MGEKILGWLEKIATGEKRRIFFAVLIVLVILGMIIFPYIDANFLYYSRIEKRIDNLTSMVELTSRPIEQNEILYAEYCSILEEMSGARENSLFGNENVIESRKINFIKFLGGSILWIIVGMVMIFNKKKGERFSFKLLMNNLLASIVCLIIGGVLGYAFLNVPTIGKGIFNFIFAVVAEIVVICLLVDSPKGGNATEKN